MVLKIDWPAVRVLVLGMLELLVVRVVLKELVVFVGGIFERVKSPNFFF